MPDQRLSPPPMQTPFLSAPTGDSVLQRMLRKVFIARPWIEWLRQIVQTTEESKQEIVDLELLIQGDPPDNDPTNFSVRTYAGTPDANSSNVELYWGYVQGANKCNQFEFSITDGTATFIYHVRAVTTAGTQTHRLDISRLAKLKPMTITIAAQAVTSTGTFVRAAVAPGAWAFTPSSNSGSTVAATLVGELDWAGGNVWFESDQWRNNIAPTNSPSFSSAVVAETGCAARTFQLSGMTYTQGAYIATHLAVFLKIPSGTISLVSDMIVSLLNVAALPSTFTIPVMVADDKPFTVGLAAVALTRSGYSFNGTFVAISVSTTSQGSYVYNPSADGILSIGKNPDSLSNSNNLRLVSDLTIDRRASDTIDTEIKSASTQDIILRPGGSKKVNVAAGDIACAAGVFRRGADQVVGGRMTGWTNPTGTASRAGYDTGTATLTQVAETLKALVDDLHDLAGHGLIGT